MSTDAAVSLATQLGRELPAPDIRLLAAAVRDGLVSLNQLRAETAGAGVRQACGQLLAASLDRDAAHVVAGVLLGSLEPDPRRPHLDVVWTGPDSGAHTSRLTSTVLVDLIDQATSTVLLVGYAVHSPPTVTAALRRAYTRGVAITLLLERTIDNPKYTGHGGAFAGIPARRLCWPTPPRPAGASLHAKILVIDDNAALIGSANLTGAALESNLECGLLVCSSPTAHRITDHIERLLNRGDLRQLL